MTAASRRLASRLLGVSLAALAVLAWGLPAHAEPRGFLLVARPELLDPNFRETVVLATQTDDGATVGVILNRPGRQSLADILPGHPTLSKFTEPLRFGGPVDAVGIFAVFRSSEPPGEALPIVPGLWLALAPATVEQLMNAPPEALRFFYGYAGWGPGQLRAEIDRGSWWLLDVEPDVAFLEDTSRLWQDLARRGQSLRAAVDR